MMVWGDEDDGGGNPNSNLNQGLTQTMIGFWQKFRNWRNLQRPSG